MKEISLAESRDELGIQIPLKDVPDRGPGEVHVRCISTDRGDHDEVKIVAKIAKGARKECVISAIENAAYLIVTAAYMEKP